MHSFMGVEGIVLLLQAFYHYGACPSENLMVNGLKSIVTVAYAEVILWFMVKKCMCIHCSVLLSNHAVFVYAPHNLIFCNNNSSKST